MEPFMERDKGFSLLARKVRETEEICDRGEL